MSIRVNKNTKVIVQGITGRSGRFHTEQCVDYGTQIVAGAVPGKGGTDVNGIPVFDTVAQGIAETGADTSLIFVPARFNAADSIMEAADAGDLVYPFAKTGFERGNANGKSIKFILI